MPYKSGGGGQRQSVGGRTGGGGGTTGGKGSGKDKKTQSELSTRERNLNAIEAIDKAPRGLDPATGKARPGGAKGADATPNALPPGLNPLKYTTNPTPSYEATPGNIASLVGSLITGLGPGSMLARVGLSDELGLSEELGLPSSGFESPTGPTTTGDYDKAETTKASQANAASTMGGGQQTNSVSTNKPKTKKPPKPGFTLLKGVGGTLIGT